MPFDHRMYKILNILLFSRYLKHSIKVFILHKMVRLSIRKIPYIGINIIDLDFNKLLILLTSIIIFFILRIETLNSLLNVSANIEWVGRK